MLKILRLPIVLVLLTLIGGSAFAVSGEKSSLNADHATKYQLTAVPPTSFMDYETFLAYQEAQPLVVWDDPEGAQVKELRRIEEVRQAEELQRVAQENRLREEAKLSQPKNFQPAPAVRVVGECTGFVIPDYIIQRESGGNPSAMNPSGAYGCAQTLLSHYASGGSCAGLDPYSIQGQRDCVNILSNGGTNLTPWAQTR